MLWLIPVKRTIPEMIETGAKSKRRRGGDHRSGRVSELTRQPRTLLRDWLFVQEQERRNQRKSLPGECGTSVLENHRRAAVSSEFLMVSDQAWRGIAVVVTTRGVSARFRTLIRNVAARTEGLEGPGCSWYTLTRIKGLTNARPGRTTGSHQAIGKESNKKILDVNDWGLLVIGKRESKRERDHPWCLIKL